MKNKLLLLFSAALSLDAALGARAQGTAFTYQGRLTDNGVPANGPYDLRFTLHTNDVAPGTQIGLTVTSNEWLVVNGLFTVTLDFGAVWGSRAVFDGTPRWLQV